MRSDFSSTVFILLVLLLSGIAVVRRRSSKSNIDRCPRDQTTNDAPGARCVRDGGSWTTLLAAAAAPSVSKTSLLIDMRTS